MAEVVILGVGFAGLNAARVLKDQPGIKVTLIDRFNYHLFTPLLYQVATGSIEPEAIVYPVRAIVRSWSNTKFRLATASGVDLKSNQLLTDGDPIPYDYLILAPGSVTNFFGNESIERSAETLKFLNDGAAVRNQILSAFEMAAHEPDPEARRSLLSFVIVGGGPTGVEFAGALAELVTLELRKDHPELAHAEVSVVLLEALDRVLSGFPADLGEYAEGRLERMGVDVRTSTRVIGVEDSRVRLEDGTEIAAGNLFWTAGVRAAELVADLSGPRSRDESARVDEHLRLPQAPNVYVVGDAAYVEQDGERLPQMAPVAIQLGEYAARHILARERGKPLEPFHYQDKGTMAVIGRGKAVARLFGRGFKGFLAWLVWLVFHLFLLIGFRNRLIVLINWAWDYLLFERKVRLITWPSGEQESSPQSTQRAQRVP